MYRKYFQRLRHQAFAVLFGIVLISACTVSAGAAVLQKSGDGLSLYEGYLYPDLPVIDSSLPYLSIEGYSASSLDPSFNEFFDYIGILRASSVPLSYLSSEDSYTLSNRVGAVVRSYVYISSDTLASVMGIPSGQWIYQGEETGPDILISNSHLLWYNHVPDGRESAHDDLLSVDGLTCLLWDGDISGLSSISGHLYSVMPYISVPDSAFAVRSTGVSSVPRFNDGRYFPPDSIFSVDGSSWSLYDPDVSSTNSSYYYSFSESPSFYLHFYDGPLFTLFTPIVVYDPASSSLVDFSQTTLTASNPQYDYQSAEFDISWSNLPEVPYPDNVQYFIQGRLSDGAASQPPEIYLGSSSDPPTSDVPVSFSFSGLQPETQYTATFELVYNTTGCFRDFTRSGVTTTVSFTTLSDGSISEGDKAIINAIQQGNKDNQQWTDSQFGSAVGDLPQDTTETDSLISGLDEQEEAYKDDAYDRFQELSSAFSGFDGSVGSGIGLAGTLFSRFFNALGSYKIIYTFPLLLGLAMVLIGRLGRSSIRMEREPGDQFKIDGW